MDRMEHAPQRTQATRQALRESGLEKPSRRRSTAAFLFALAFPITAHAPLAGADDVITLAPHARHGETSVAVVEWLNRDHFIRKPLDDAASSDTFDGYLDLLDPTRVHFLAEDIRELEQYRFVLDDALKSGELEPAFDIYNRFHERVIERLEFSLNLVEDGIGNFDFGLDEKVKIDRAEAAWPAHEAEAHHIWRQRAKGTVLNMLLSGQEADKVEERLAKRYRTQLRRARQVTNEEAFGFYINAYAATFDRHTQYFSPRDSEDFNINMSLSLEGIGAVLGPDDEYTSVVRLVAAGPADKGGQLKPADRIVAVGQGRHGALIDVIGMRLDDVVELIRGPKGSVVRLQVIPAVADDTSGETSIVSITRNTVRLEEQSAQSQVLTVNDGIADRRIGVVSVPTFYIDFKARQEGRPDYRSTTRDVRRLIDELKGQHVDGIVVDLRNNGGGSLEEASSLAGLFIDTGPTVQVKMARRDTRVQSDNDNGFVAWDGPMAVLVNRLSASASEIFAGAIQDYGRGIITGNRTFGKGTVQTLIELDRGQLKMTQAKFYRVSGLSPQSQGVAPDIHFPDPPGADRLGNDEDESIGWDRVEPAHYRVSGELDPLLGTLRHRHEQRVEDDPEFNYLRARADRSREITGRTHISLLRTEREEQKESDDAWALELENTLLLARGEEPAESLEELRKRPLNNAIDRALDGTGDPGDEESPPDPLLRETAHVLADFIGLTRHVAMRPTETATVVQ